MGGLCWVALGKYQQAQQRKKLEDSKEIIRSRPSMSHPSGPSRLVQYNTYHMSTKEFVLYAIVSMGLLGIVGYLFYKNGMISFIVSLAGLYYPVIRKKELIRKQKAQLQLQFKQALSSISSALGAGKSVESAFQEALMDVRMLYPDPETFIIKELETIQRRIENGETIESALKDWSDRSGLDDLQQFTEVFMTCKRTGGNLVHVIRRTASIIQEKLDIQQDIQVMLAQKRFESKVLTFAPLAVIGILSISSPDYMEPIYGGAGMLIMTCALAVLIGCYALTKIIMNIKV